jgi:CheY-like chemotaxis protein
MTHLYQDHRRVLIVDDNLRKLKLRAAVLRNHEIEVHTACGYEEASSLWKTIPYDLVLLAFAENSEIVAAATQLIRKSKPRQRVGLLVGPPRYIREITKAQGRKVQLLRPPHEKATESSAQRPEMMERILGDWYMRQRMGRGAETLAS